MAKANHPPAYLYYPDDFSANGKVEAMTTEQVGAYQLLLNKAWSEHPVASIPNDDRILARWTRLTDERWLECKAAVLAPFTLRSDNRWHSRRLREEFDKIIRARKAKSDAGRLGVKAKRSKDLLSSAEAVLPAVLKQRLSISSSSSISHSPPSPPGGVEGEGESKAEADAARWVERATK